MNGKLTSVETLNRKKENGQRVKISHNFRQVDAQSFYEGEITKLAYKVETEQSKLEKSNSGFCFILLKSSDLARRFHFNHYF